MLRHHRTAAAIACALIASGLATAPNVSGVLVDPPVVEYPHGPLPLDGRREPPVDATDRPAAFDAPTIRPSSAFDAAVLRARIPIRRVGRRPY
jgi:hypothetical protein